MSNVSMPIIIMLPTAFVFDVVSLSVGEGGILPLPVQVFRQMFDTGVSLRLACDSLEGYSGLSYIRRIFPILSNERFVSW